MAAGAVAASTGPGAGFAAVAPEAVNAAPRLLWQGPTQVRAGQNFSVLLRGSGTAAWQQLQLEIGFDPKALQLNEVRAGAIFEPADGSGSLLQQGDASAGSLRVTLARGAAPADTSGTAGTAGTAGIAPASMGGPPADLLILGFKALREGSTSLLRLRRAEAQPAPATPASLPVEHRLRVVP